MIAFSGPQPGSRTSILSSEVRTSSEHRTIQVDDQRLLATTAA